MPKSPLALLVALVALVLPAAATAAPAHAHRHHACHRAGTSPSPRTAALVRRATLCLLDRQRIRHGLRPLRARPALRLAGDRHAVDMARHRYFAHVSRSGRTVGDRAVAAGYAAHHGSWFVGENLAWGVGAGATPRVVVRQWMASPVHRHNVLNPRFRDAGVGLALRAPYGPPSAPGATYDLNFGVRR